MAIMTTGGPTTLNRKQITI